jgi:hypothetical protein
MPLIHEPNPLPSPLDYFPPGSWGIPPQPGWSFYNYADFAAAKAYGMTVLDICFFNFRTRRPIEINWYLKYKIGCTKTTKDGKNYIFSGFETEAIFIPEYGCPPPLNEVSGKQNLSIIDELDRKWK